MMYESPLARMPHRGLRTVPKDQYAIADDGGGRPNFEADPDPFTVPFGPSGLTLTPGDLAALDRRRKFQTAA